MYKIVKTGKKNITVKVVADSISHTGERITTFEIDYHRYVHSELMTHRMFSRNAASSRAIPVKSTVDNIRNNPAMPVFWSKNQAGMQSHIEHDNIIMFYGDNYSPDELWNHLIDFNTQAALAFDEAGYHKQVPNRITEPYQMIKVIVTGTSKSFDNFFNLRFENLTKFQAQHEIHELGKLMYYAYAESSPVILSEFDWHTPFYGEGYWSPRESYNINEALDSILLGDYSYVSTLVDINGVSLIDALRVASSCCAQVSYRKLDDSIEKAIDIYGKLVMSEPVHASALEHCAKPIRIVNGFDDFDWECGVTHVKRDGTLCSGNFEKWIQYRQLIPNHVCNEFILGE